MKRIGNVIEEIVRYPNLYDAVNEVLSSTARKRTRVGRCILANREKEIESIGQQISSGSIDLSFYYERDVFEHGKQRHLQVLPLRKRIAINAVMRVVDKHLKPRFIRTTGASIEGRGMHDLMSYIRDDMRRDPEGTKYCYKFDVKKFYESIDQQEVMKAVRRVFKDPTLIGLLEQFVTFTKQGLSIGLRSSQGLANLLMSANLDHYLKEEVGVRHYYRYCDDGVVLAGDKRTLWKIRELVHRRLEAIGLKVKEGDRIFPVTEGLDFLGYVMRGAEDVRLRKRVKQRMARRMAKVKSRKRRRVLVASFYGMAKHANCKNLFYTLTGQTMKSFKDLGVSYAPADGKKRFPGTTVSIRELVNLPIVVRDFETGIRTEQGEDRTLVAVEVNGEPRKFFTASVEMKNILMQVREMSDGFPFETVIRAEAFGKGKTKYVFT